MIWWVFCCGDEGSVQSSSSDAPQSSPPAVPPLTRLFDDTSLTTAPSAAAPAPSDNQDDKEESHRNQDRVSDSPAVGKAFSDKEDPETAAWSKALTLLLEGSVANDHPQKLPVLSLGAAFPPPTEVSHVPQLSTWDCGIACLQMVLGWLGLEAVAGGTGRQAIMEAISTRSVWTADLVLYLDRILYGNDNSQPVACGLLLSDTGGSPSVGNRPRTLGRYLLCSQTLTVNDELGSFAYYQRAFDEDRVRVQKIFEFLKVHRSDQLLQRSLVRVDDIVAIVCRPDCVAIVLVDNAVLTGLRQCCQLEPNPAQGSDRVEAEPGGDSRATDDGPNEQHQSEETKNLSATLSTVLYMGHYILVTGVVSTRNVVVGEYNDDADYDDDEDEDEPFMFQVQNPSLDFGPVLLSPRLLDQARVAPGTDHDIIFVVKASDPMLTESGA